MNRNCFSIFLLLLCLPVLTIAGTLSGRVVDEKGLPLPFATVYVQGTTIGTSSNTEGYYSLPLQPGTYKLVCQYIGFRQSFFSLTLTGSETVKHDFSLAPQDYQLRGVTVKATDEDPAYRIIRNAIKRRGFHLKQIRSFQTSLYVKGVLRNRNIPDNILGFSLTVNDKKQMSSNLGLDSNGRGVVYVCEEIADYYSMEPNKTKVVIHSVKESGDPQGAGLGNVPAVVVFYENNVKLFGNSTPRGVISPISNNALNYYRYKLQGEFKEGETTVYKIKVTPKRQYEPCMSGDIYISDGDWAIHSLKLLMTQKNGLDMLDTLMVEQTFLPLRPDVWVIKNQVLYPTIGIMGFDFAGSFVSVYDNQKVNEPIPDSIFNKRMVVMYDDDANKKDTVYWAKIRPLQLEVDELHDYKFKDSVRLVEEDPVRLDSLRRMGNRFRIGGLLLDGITVNSKGYKNKWSVSPIISDVNYNTVEGLNYSPDILLRTRLDTGKVLNMGLGMRYGFSNTHFNAKGSVRYTQSDPHWDTRNWSLAVMGGKYISQYNNFQPVPEFFNTYSALLEKNNYFKIYERWFAAFMLSRNHGNGFAWNIAASWQHRMPLENTTDYTWAKSSRPPFDSNTPEELAGMTWEDHKAVIVRAGISFNPGFTYSRLPGKTVPHGSKWPLFTLSYEKGIPDLLDSKTDFDKWRFAIKDNMNLGMLGSIEYNVAAGGFLNSKYVSLPDMIHLNGNRYALATTYLNGFQLAPYYRYSNTAKIYGEAHIEYYLKGLLTNKIPLLRQTHSYFVLGNNTFYTEGNQYYAEAFLGLDNLGYKFLRLLRVDFVYGWDSAERTYTGLRIGLHTSGLIKTVTPNAGAEEF